MRAGVIVGVLALVSACNGVSPTAPTPPPAPPPVSTPPPTVQPPPAPTILNYAGRWTGQYIVEQCAGSSGSMDDVLCSAPRGGNPGGIFQRGMTFPITLDLSQNGSAVNGSWALGSIVGTVSGSVVSQAMILSGNAAWSDSASGFVFSSAITQWDTVLAEGGFLLGGFSMSLRINVFPGDGVVRVRLSNVRR